MPRGDRTGPMGMGSKTGRGFGYCMGYGMPGYAISVPAGSIGAGFAGDFRPGRAGHGRRFRRRFNVGRFPGWGQYYSSADAYAYPMSTPRPDLETEKRLLQDQSNELQTQLDLINKRLNALETKETKNSEE